MSEATSVTARAAATRAHWVPGVEGRAGKFPGPSLIPALNAIQARLGWLPREELEELAREVKRPRYEIEGIVSFYPHFRTTPPPKVALHVCHDLSCWLRGGEDRIAAVKARYGADTDVELVEVSCLGRCDVAPAADVNEHPTPVSEMAAVDALVDAARGDGVSEAVASSRTEPWPNDPYAAGSGVGERYASLRALLTGELNTDEVVATLSASGLRGMGGAGFPTGKKWELVAGTDDPVKYAICNADESEPGTFKDRQILADQPHLVLEGLLLGMAVVGAEQGYVFIRHEYGPEERVLRAEIDALRAAGVVGPDACGSGRRLDLEIFVSPGGYILGEETALLECMEGHRGEPRNKPPFPGNYGLHGRPTLINSVETFADVPVILQRGAQWWGEQGLGDSVGWKFFAVSGHVENPGVYCVPMGTTVRALIDLAGGVQDGKAVGAVQPGGASSNFIGPDQLDLALDFGTLAEAGTMLGSGALVVLAEGTDLLAAATNVLRFFRNESCGKCVPCRAGSTKAHTLLAGKSTLDDEQRSHVLRLEEAMRKTSICGLGQVALGPVVSVLGLDKGGAAARPQPRPNGAKEQPDR
ncbi:NAD(P)H-dependent oxidoreductase subunit E [Actinophytocola algeriensis]|uniref:Formate dehydrogenase/NADH-quinone oxidoreductase subunit F n=1 Tax=Actinophytocola algeriensis TaxID=1768010 RepID=A0A7W7Q805_9PSEU|nr:NAD(P)H-dependent oxidoreductase subunit E [Actinophytocola algeriensis]MBB4908647.1 formate dehydrogenase/NADH-quinone oxidoreductase subunit F [Actinophytocola algeriensis]MBE1474966.1 formate dehydrogenase/NADH-quinone oxidoreductase subunit F [Actinophytocola algeriensis]